MFLRSHNTNEDSTCQHITFTHVNLHIAHISAISQNGNLARYNLTTAHLHYNTISQMGMEHYIVQTAPQWIAINHHLLETRIVLNTLDVLSPSSERILIDVFVVLVKEHGVTNLLVCFCVYSDLMRVVYNCFHGLQTSVTCCSVCQVASYLGSKN